MWRLSLLLGLWLMPAAAEASVRCALPRTLEPARVQEPDWRNTAAKTQGYVLALSWSPEYCARSSGRWRDGDLHQCRDNSFGLVVHGLWPQGAGARNRKDHPRHCRTATPLAAATLRAHLCTVPGVRLMQHQWAAHGTCAFTTAEGYFTAIERLNSVLTRPDLEALQASKGKTLTVNDVRRAFAAANARIGLAGRHLGIDVTDRQRLREIRICYDRAFRFTACDRPGAPDRLLIRIRPRP